MVAGTVNRAAATHLSDPDVPVSAARTAARIGGIRNRASVGRPGGEFLNTNGGRHLCGIDEPHRHDRTRLGVRHPAPRGEAGERNDGQGKGGNQHGAPAAGRDRRERGHRARNIERQCDLAGVSGALVGLLCKTPLNDPRERGRRARRQRGRRVAKNGGREVGVRLILKGGVTGRHLVQDDAKRPDIAAGIREVALQHLRRHVGQRSSHQRVRRGLRHRPRRFV